jgi:hypothetical protein
VKYTHLFEMPVNSVYVATERRRIAKDDGPRTRQLHLDLLDDLTGAGLITKSVGQSSLAHAWV